MRAPWPRHMYKLASVVSPMSTIGRRINARAELGSSIFVSGHLSEDLQSRWLMDLVGKPRQFRTFGICILTGYRRVGTGRFHQGLSQPMID